MSPDKSISDEEKIAIGLQIIEDYATGNYTVQAACEKNKVDSRGTFWRWRTKFFPEHLAQPFEEAKRMVNDYDREVRTGRALSGLDKLLDIHEYEEIKKITTPIYETDKNGKTLIKDGKPVIKAVKSRQEKKIIRVMPQFAAVKFHLTAHHPDYKPIGKDGDVPVDLEGAEDNAYYYTMPDGTKLKF